jgi:hypothetical protein
MLLFKYRVEVLPNSSVPYGRVRAVNVNDSSSSQHSRPSANTTSHTKSDDGGGNGAKTYTYIYQLGEIVQADGTTPKISVQRCADWIDVLVSRVMSDSAGLAHAFLASLYLNHLVARSLVVIL